MKFLVAGACALMFAGTAAAFDNAQCQPFLVGTWESKATSGNMELTHIARFDANGTFTTQSNGVRNGEAFEGRLREFKWFVAAGEKAWECAVHLTGTAPDGKAMSDTFQLQVTDDTTIWIVPMSPNEFKRK